MFERIKIRQEQLSAAFLDTLKSVEEPMLLSSIAEIITSDRLGSETICRHTANHLRRLGLVQRTLDTNYEPPLMVWSLVQQETNS